MRGVPHDLEVREGEHVLDLLGRQPRFRRLAVLEAQQLAEAGRVKAAYRLERALAAIKDIEKGG